MSSPPSLVGLPLTIRWQVAVRLSVLSVGGADLILADTGEASREKPGPNTILTRRGTEEPDSKTGDHHIRRAAH